MFIINKHHLVRDEIEDYFNCSLDIKRWELYPSEFRVILNVLKSIALNETITYREESDWNEYRNIQVSWSEFDLFKSTSQVLLFTGGTTGTPKPAKHGIEILLKSVRPKVDTKGFICAYGLFHIAFFKVFLQAFVSKVPLYILKNLRIDEEELSILNKYHFTHLNCTPTFLRVFEAPHPLFGVKRIVSGGERLFQNDLERIKNILPNAKLRNIYASTEKGTIMTSEDIFFSLDRMPDFMMIRDNSIFFKNQGVWEDSGDRVRLVGRKFEITGRSGDIVNVGGSLYNILDCENLLLEGIAEIREVEIYTIPSKIVGSLIAANIVLSTPNLDHSIIERKIHKLLANEFRISIINFVETITKTSSLKVKRS